MYIKVTDITGTHHYGDTITNEESTEEKVDLLCRDFKNMNGFSIRVDGRFKYFNPAHIICVQVRDDNSHLSRR